MHTLPKGNAQQPAARKGERLRAPAITTRSRGELQGPERQKVQPGAAEGFEADTPASLYESD